VPLQFTPLLVIHPILKAVMSSIAQPWLVSRSAIPRQSIVLGLIKYARFVDPVFAICVGSAAAAIRIRREQIAKHPDQENDFANLWKKAQRMGKGYVTAYRDAEK
jgi:hypothetical protein